MESNLASAPEPSEMALVDGADSTQDPSILTSFCCENCIPVDDTTQTNGAVSPTEDDSPCKYDTQCEGGYNPHRYYSPYNNLEEPVDPYICHRCLLESAPSCTCPEDWGAGQQHDNFEDEFPTQLETECGVTKSSSDTTFCNCQTQKKRRGRAGNGKPMPTVVLIVLNKPTNAGQYSCDMSPTPPQRTPQVQFQLPHCGSQQSSVNSSLGYMPSQNFNRFCSHQVYQPGLNSLNQEPQCHKKTRRCRKMNEVDKAVLEILQNENYMCLLPDLAAKKLLEKSTKKKKLRSPFDRFANPHLLYEPKIFVPRSKNGCNSCCCSTCCNSSFCW